MVARWELSSVDARQFDTGSCHDPQFPVKAIKPSDGAEKDTIVLGDFANSTGDPIFDDTLKQALTTALRFKTVAALECSSREPSCDNAATHEALARYSSLRRESLAKSANALMARRGLKVPSSV
jgi:hypothetical protein